MSKTNSIVEVNGSRYDALTGQLLNPRKLTMPRTLPGKKVIDGFTLGAHHKPSKARLEHSPPKADGIHQRTQRSSTLMRQAVKKPAVLKKEADQPPTARSSKQHPIRALRAKTVTKHAKVNRFGVLPTSSTKELTAPAKVKMTAKASYRDKDASDAPRVPSMVTSVSHRKIEQMLDEALVRADAHKHMMNDAKRRTRLHSRVSRLPKWLTITLATIILIAAAFWLIWQNLPTVAVHVAAARAHVNASMPSYTPSGYNFAGPIKYHDGAVTMQFKDSSGQFSITQKASNWNSTSLVSNYIPANESMQTSQVGGTTVYIYGDNSNAAWVNRGVMYSLKNDARLNSDQVLKIVQGL